MQLPGMGNGERDNALAQGRIVGQRDKKTTDDAPSFYFFETLLDEAHPSSRKFYDLVLEAALLHARKQKDYGRDSDPFSNVRASEEWGIEGWIGACVRLNDKVRRLQKLATLGELVNEAARDSFLDIAVYALIACVLYEEQASS